MMIRRIARIWAFGIALFGALDTAAQTSAGKPILLDAALAADGRAVELVWQDAIPMRSRDTRLSRRVLGATGPDSWQEWALLPGRFIKATDDSLVPGIAYEYRVLRSHGDFFSAGYWATGTNIPARQDHGTVFIALDDTLPPALQPHLTRLGDDLTGAGWRVRWLPTPRHVRGDPVQSLAQARALKAQLRAGVAAQPPGLRHMVLLLGHVPIVTSGRVAPDGHEALPHASDLFYGDLTGDWQDDGAGRLIHNRLPDGAIEMPVGRVDFAGLADGDRALEQAHLRAYLDKAHHWRHGLLGDLRTAYGQSGHLQVEQFDLRNIVGPDAVARGGHHDVGEAQPWLWGVDFGHHDGRTYPDRALKAVFAINFGSHKQKIERPNNAMTGTLAQPFYTVAVGWGGRPAWRLHGMALGRTIGEVQQATANNGAGGTGYPGGMDYVPTGSYPWRAPIWANLLGDPTLAAFPLAPPQAFRARTQGSRVVLEWEGRAERYLLLRSDGQGGAFTPLASVTGVQRYVDDTPLPGARYQLRALGRQEVYAGSFHTASQGVFARVDEVTPTAPDLVQRLTGPGPHRLTLGGGALLAPLHPPGLGRLTLRADGWYYTPEDGFDGVVTLPLSAHAAGQTITGRLRLEITPVPSAPTDSAD